ncbi:MAG: hypothetical protein K8953_06790, partial [Proteobacteria bacterium]|nr:hypothetical protein [Pseudomonadota bacterium]
TTAKWAGAYRDTFYATDESGVPFALTVGFAAEGGTLDGIVPRNYGTIRLGINGAFDADGIITGDVIHGDTNDGDCVTTGVLTVTEGCFTDNTNRITATLTGLIGEQGAVAAFIGQRGSFPNQLGWIGGFVATPDFCSNIPSDPDCNTNSADWVDSFGGTAPPATIAAAAQTGVFGGFLNLAANEIAPGNLKTESGGSIDSASVNFNRNAGGHIDGVVYIGGYNGTNHQAFVGIRPSTNLGLPLIEQPASAAWNGTYYDSTHASVSNVITFDIDFSNRDINTSGIAVVSPPVFDLGFTDAGVITGTVTKNGNEATARGLIGEQGLVGVYVDTSPGAGPVFYGGFVATNPSP